MFYMVSDFTKINKRLTGTFISLKIYEIKTLLVRVSKRNLRPLCCDQLCLV